MWTESELVEVRLSHRVIRVIKLYNKKKRTKLETLQPQSVHKPSLNHWCAVTLQIMSDMYVCRVITNAPREHVAK